MGFLVPAALGLAVILPGIVALYFLKLRRHGKEVSSTWLWRPVLLDRQANSLWQRLRVSLLLLVQLLAAAALILGASHPYKMVRATSAGTTVVLLDATASMHATDIAPNRFSAAREQVRELIRQRPPGARMSLILLTRAPQILVAHSDQAEALLSALSAAAPTAGDGDLGQAMTLAYSLLRGQEDGQIILVGSGRYRGAGELAPSPVPFTYIPIGSDAAQNLAVSTFATRLIEGNLMAFAQVTNYGTAATPATAEFWADGKLVRLERQTVEPGEGRAFAWTVPADARELEVRLPAPDALALDNRAWTLPGGQQRSRILLVSEGNPFLQKALTLIPGAQVTTMAPKDWATGGTGTAGATPPPSTPPGTAAGGVPGYDLYVLDRISPPPGPATGRLLLINPPGPTEERFVGRILPRQSDPLLKYVDVREVHINLAHVHAPPADARLLWEGQTEKGNIPLLWTEGNDRAVFGFTMQQSDLPLRIAFPILIQNLAGWLLPPAPVDAPAVQPGESVALRPWPTASRLQVTLPDGSRQSWDVSPGMNPPFFEATLPGLYRVTQTVGGGAREARFAVNLFSSLVSDLTPAAELRVPVLPEAGQAQTEAPLDLWRWLGWAALGLIGLEWWVYRRGY